MTGAHCALFMGVDISPCPQRKECGRPDLLHYFFGQYIHYFPFTNAILAISSVFSSRDISSC
jgi:hypothetical protein